jgi:phosphoribosylformimino-5-aminoimidazole carboxamide ribotide isomerase
MIAIPAVDLRDGCCVQLVGGSFDDERIRLADPIAVARRWIDDGFRTLHVVDLDAAMESGRNAHVVRVLVGLPGVSVQVGGGIRTDDDVQSLLDAGAARVVVGTRALADRDWLEALAARWPNRIIVAADARGGRAVARGWRSETGDRALDVIADLQSLPLAGILVTAVDKEGQMAGPDLALVSQAVSASAQPIIASGGIGSLTDLDSLAAAGASACVIGMALYTGALDSRAVARSFAS